MTFVHLKRERINLDQVLSYRPDERFVTILNKQIKWYSIVLEGAHRDLTLEYQEDIAARDTDLLTLDFMSKPAKR